MRIAAVVATAVVAASLSACSVSQNERDACEARGGSVQDEKFVYKDSGIFTKKAGRLYYCEATGDIVEVYNEKIVSVDEGFLGDSADNERVFEACTRMEGSVYKTSTGGKYPKTRWVCVHGGQAVQILK